MNTVVRRAGRYREKQREYQDEPDSFQGRYPAAECCTLTINKRVGPFCSIVAGSFYAVKSNLLRNPVLPAESDDPPGIHELPVGLPMRS